MLAKDEAAEACHKVATTREAARVAKDVAAIAVNDT